MDNLLSFIVLGAIFGGLAVYFLPFLVAYFRDSTNKLAVFLVNFFFGWSVLGWVAALIMALTSERRMDAILRNAAIAHILQHPQDDTQGFGPR